MLYPYLYFGYQRDPAKGEKQAYINLTMQLGPYQPVNISFPRTSGRTFRQEWYKSYEWLEYSQELDSAFCFYCRAFPTVGMETAFVSCGFKKWGKANQRFSIHQKSNSHKEAFCKVNGYKQSISSSGNIIGLIDKNHSKVVSDNRNYLKNILETLLYCAKQGIAIRGHEEDSKSINKGNFIELLTLRAKDNNLIQRYYLDKEKSFNYVHHSYLNMFLTYMSDYILKSIISEILSAGIFSILIDETQDLSRHEQVSVFIRYVNNLEPKEVKENSLAVYLHCYAHILNLCLVDLAKQITCVRNMFGTLRTLYSFIGASSKRFSVFEQMLSSDVGPKTLKTLCDTRWSCRYEALRSVFHNLTAVIDTLAEIAESDRECGSDAAALLKSIQTFEFIFSLILLEDTNILSKYLQSSTLNYGLVSQMVKETIRSFEELRTDENFQKVWDKAAIISESGFSQPKLPRIKSIPLKLGGGKKQTLQTVQDHFRTNVFYGIIDTVIMCMNSKFKENDLSLLNSMNNVLFNESPSNQSIEEVCNTYKVESNDLSNEIKILNRLFINHECNSIIKKINYIKSNDIQTGFPSYTNILKIFLTIPTNTASNERSFSALRRLKTYLRVTMNQERLSSLAVLYIQKEYPIDYDYIIDKFDAEASIRGRRLTQK
ncbi:Uncharacterized protein FWK35_00034325 [Aphis craccivora]|uniref:TTF-type domain-containing protein n=1 Tax=Aphis craccivora TaxID=307492 RepID=A0A6G0VYD8_APHCR|nr:Uncharacterized protein FWK35_00034325 [Aphis craccivora]